MGGTPDAEIEQDRLARLAEASEGLQPGWEETFAAGSFGAHEFLDRVSVVADFIDRTLLDHPACILNPEWFSAASRLVEVLGDLYQAVEAEQEVQED